ncbi:uncharacterized protein LOC131993889 [Centropristis striata]|uniref:uncharacterized protein LOC131993889 n=1 Tax=Centropristis striata TaxID=184440 RepID=UPI0027DF158D|nr:uncharacterized protein LOC131993889 [Centropristis striata]
MKVLNKDELQIAEGVLLKHLPKSIKVYGFLYTINRNKPSTLEVIVDSWPDFKVIICRTDPKKRALEFRNKVSYFSTDEQILRKMLTEENVIDWSINFVVAGFDISHAIMLKEVSSEEKVNKKCTNVMRLLYLPDSSHLLPPAVDRELESRISSLNLSHVDLVNKTWKFGGDEQGLRIVTYNIINFPSCCITDNQGQPLAWILLYDCCALAMLYTLPEHRGKGYAKVLISAMATRLFTEGYPVYSLVEEDNKVSFSLFKKLGFIEVPLYRAAWFEFNFYHILEQSRLNLQAGQTVLLKKIHSPNMKVLNKEELQIAEGVLLKHLPRSFKAYGFLHAINRNKPSTLEVIVDSWPDFKVIICRPDPKNKRALEFMKKVSYHCTDEQILRKMLTEENAIDWSTYFLIGGLDTSHAAMLKDVSSDREVNNRLYTAVHLMYLPDISHLLPPAVNSELEPRISSLNLSHVDLVNKTWKFGGNEQGFRNITNLLSNFPSCCITDGQGQPVSWILLYDYCAMGLLYTLPEHRGKGYAKVLISAMATKLFTEGYPVYCFIEEDNEVSYKLFKNLGFIEDPSYRAAWLEFNF